VKEPVGGAPQTRTPGWPGRIGLQHPCPWSYQTIAGVRHSPVLERRPGGHLPDSAYVAGSRLTSDPHKVCRGKRPAWGTRIVVKAVKGLAPSRSVAAGSPGRLLDTVFRCLRVQVGL